MDAVPPALAAGKEQIRVGHGPNQCHSGPERPLQLGRNQRGQSVAGKRGADLRVCRTASGRAGMAEQTDHPVAERPNRRGGSECAAGRWLEQPERLYPRKPDYAWIADSLPIRLPRPA